MNNQPDADKRYVGRFEFYMMVSSIFCFMNCALNAARSKTEWFPNAIIFCLLFVQLWSFYMAYRIKNATTSKNVENIPASTPNAGT